MKLRKIPFLIGIFIILLSCNKDRDFNSLKQFEQNEIIKQCIDTTISIGSHYDNEYLLDFSNLKNLQTEIINSYLETDNQFEVTILDTLFKSDQQWLQYGVLSKKVISFYKIEIIDKGKVRVELSHLWSSDGSFGLEIIFEKNAVSYRILSVKMIWIS